MGLDYAHNDIGAGLEPGMGVLQHLIGLADARGGANKNLQFSGTNVRAPGLFQKGLRRGTQLGVSALTGHEAI